MFNRQKFNQGKFNVSSDINFEFENNAQSSEESTFKILNQFRTKDDSSFSSENLTLLLHKVIENFSDTGISRESSSFNTLKSFAFSDLIMASGSMELSVDDFFMHDLAISDEEMTLTKLLKINTDDSGIAREEIDLLICKILNPLTDETVSNENTSFVLKKYFKTNETDISEASENMEILKCIFLENEDLAVSSENSTFNQIQSFEIYNLNLSSEELHMTSVCFLEFQEEMVSSESLISTKKIWLEMDDRATATSDNIKDLALYYYDHINLKDIVLKPGDELIIDTDLMTVTLNGQNAMRYFSSQSDFFKLAPGENIIAYSDDSETKEYSVDILWKDRWL